jgi:hypothetical protein
VTEPVENRYLSYDPETDGPETSKKDEAPVGNPLVNQGAFVQALGINPAMVRTGSIKIEFNAEGQALVSFITVLNIEPLTLTAALQAAATT